MKKNITRLFSVLLAAVMVFGTLPVSAMGTDVADPPASTVDDAAVAASTAEPEESSAADETSDDAAQPEEQSAEEENAVTYASNDSFYKIVHLDCGRKYFSKNWIIALLYEMKNDGYNQLQLAFGNDGLRFLLDDMSFTANGTTYSHEMVVSKVKAGNKAQNSSGDDSYLTQSEMDEIIVKANELDIEIVPLLNLPGHANAILDIADDAYNASGSNNTLDVANSVKAREFGKAIFQKYVDYFAGKNCKFFNFGADEYANDASGTFSFSRLNSTEYQQFVTFINDLAGYIIEKRMTPRAFNDGLYYNNQGMTASTNLSKVQVCYWSSGWGNYPVASASTISQNGYEMINTNGDFYYVLGKNDNFDSGYSYASGFNNTVFAGDTTISNPVGSMFCIWCDYPNAETEQQVAANTRLVLRAMAQRMDGQTVNVNDEVVANGFNADGSVNGATDDSDIKISIGDSTEAATSGELTVGSKMVLHASKTVDWTTSNEDVATIASADETGVNSISNDSAVSASAINVTAAGVGNATITATDGEKTAEFAVTVQETETEDITVSENADNSDTVVVGSYTGPYQTDDETIATVTTSVKEITGKTSLEAAEVGVGTFYVSTSSSVSEKPSNQLTFEDAGNGQYYIKNGNNYIYPDATYTRGWGDGSWSYSLKTGKQPVKVTTSGNGIIISKSCSSGSNTTTAYLTLGRKPNWSGSYTYSADDSRQTLYLYKEVTTETTNQTTITFHGVKEGNTSVVIGGVTYNIHVMAEDLSTVDPLKIEYWITNARVDGNSGVTKENYVSIKATASGIATENGVDVTTLVDSTATRDSRDQKYWKSVILNTQKENNSTSKTELQTGAKGDDDTLSGSAFTKVRYYNRKWQVYTTEWVDVDRSQVTVTYTDNGTKTYSGDKNQLVAYYMEVLDISKTKTDGTAVTEMNVGGSDWGTRGSSTSNTSYNGYISGEGVCSLSFQIVYESGATNPASKEASALITKTYFYNYWDKRGVGTLNLDGQGCEIYKVTATTGDLTCNYNSAHGYLNNISLQWNDDETLVWGDDSGSTEASQKSVSIANNTNYPDVGTDAQKNLSWGKNGNGNGKNNSAILIRIYVKSVAEKNLTVHYFMNNTDDSKNEFHSYKIGVNETTRFSNEFGIDSNSDTGLKNNTVTNFADVEETVTSVLTGLTTIPAQYRYTKYTLINAYASDNGLDAYLIYTFDNTASFVVDFGTSLKLEPKNINDSLYGSGVNIVGVEVSAVSYGKVETDDNHNIIYTPSSSFPSSKEGETLTVTYTGTLQLDENKQLQQGAVTYVVSILPASNVLYEEDFLTSDQDTEKRWKKELPTTSTGNQQTQKVGSSDTYSVFGNDESYNSSVGKNGAWKVSNLGVNTPTKPLTTTFYGNTFDLIGTCGYHTGKVIMLIKTAEGAESSKAKIVVVDTRYNDGGAESSATLYQVPLAHVDMGADATYDVKIYASGLAATTAGNDTNSVTAKTVLAASADDSYDVDSDEIAAILEENGLTIDQVEVVTTSAMTEIAAAGSEQIAVASLPDGERTAVDHGEGNYVEIDGFRVYRSTATSDENETPTVADNYPVTEQNVNYWNILDVIKGEITAYTESDNARTVAVQQYEKDGGPQNEIYLASGQGVAFKLTDTSITSVQVSLRAVSGSTGYNNTAIGSNTEMYYSVNVQSGIFTITNTGTGNSLLAIGNVKLPSSVTDNMIQQASAISNEELAAAIQLAIHGAEEPEVFTPDTFTAKTTATKVIRNKVVTLKVTVSSDVAYVTINGVKYTRTGFQSAFNKNRTILVVNTVPKDETKTYEIVAYNANGVASETKTVTG